MAASHKGAISFGLVHIPVSLHTATQDVDIHFNQLHKDDHSRIRYKKTCGHCGKEVSSTDIIKGYEYEKDKYVVVTDEDFERIKTDKDRALQIIHFTDLSSIRPIYFDKTYQAIPEAGGEKAYELLRRAMHDENKVAIAHTVMGTKETLLMLLATDESILVEVLFYEEEIKQLPKAISRPEVSDTELSMAKTLIASMDKPFEPEQYKDEYQERLKELISDKIAGKEIVAAQSENEGTVIDLMEALKASVAKAKKPVRAKKKTG